MSGIATNLSTNLATNLATDLSGGGDPVQAILGAGYFARYRANDPNKSLDGSNNVISLKNMAASGELISQGTAGKRPAWSATSFNGGPGVTFVAASNTNLQGTMTTPRPINSRSYCWLVTTITGGANKAMAALSTPTNVARIVDYDSVAFFGCVRRQDAVTLDIVSSAVAYDANRHLLEFGFTAGGTATFVIDGAATNAAHDYLPSAVLDTISLGDLPEGGTAQSGVFCDFIVYAGDPTAGQLAAMRAYLKGANFPGYTGSSYGLP